jgi:hypothetical protein
MNTFSDFMISEAVKKDEELRKLHRLSRMGIALAKRLTTYFPALETIDPILDCDIEIRRMADDLLEESTKP